MIDRQAFEGLEATRLQHLADTYQWSELIRRISPDVVARDWLAFHADNKTISWASDLMMSPPREMLHQYEFRRKVLEILVESAPVGLLPALAASALEHWFDDSEETLEWIESKCKVSPRMRETVRNAWFRNDVSRATYARLRAAAGGSLSDDT